MCAQAHLSALFVLATHSLLSTHAQTTLSSKDSVYEGSSHKKSGLVEIIRRQLMEDNYDYMSSESEEHNPGDEVQNFGQYRHDRPSKTEPVKSQPYFRAQDSAQQEDTHQDEHFNELYNKPGFTRTTASPYDIEFEIKKNNNGDSQLQSLVQRAKDINDIKHSREVSKKDLLYYINEDRFRRAGSESDYQDSGSEEEHEPTTTTVKYKVFTVQSAGGGAGRRSGTDGRGELGEARSKRVFLREQRSGEVVLVRLDDKPFPDFRLPSARRQYMERTADNEEYDELGQNAE